MRNAWLDVSVLCASVATGAAVYGMLTARSASGGKRPLGEPPGLFVAMAPALALVEPVSLRLLRLWPGLNRWTAGNLAAAGLGHLVRPDELLSLRFVLGLLMALVGVNFGAAAALGMAALGLIFPDLWTLGAIQERHAEIRRAMPYVVDLLALCTLAGLEFGSAIDRVLGRIGAGPLKEELQLTRRDITLGRSLTGALLEMGRRIRLPEMTSFVAILCQGLEMGAGVTQVLAAQAEKMRLERMEKAERSGAQAQQKILLPLLLLMLPAFACLVFIPLLVSQAGAYMAGFKAGGAF